MVEDNREAAAQAASGTESESNGALSQGQVEIVEPTSVPGKVELIKGREKVRWSLAKALLWITFAIIVFTVLLIAFAGPLGVAVEDSTSILAPMFASISTLLGSVVGFYFASEAARERD